MPAQIRSTLSVWNVFIYLLIPSSSDVLRPPAYKKRVLGSQHITIKISSPAKKTLAQKSYTVVNGGYGIGACGKQFFVVHIPRLDSNHCHLSPVEIRYPSSIACRRHPTASRVYGNLLYLTLGLTQLDKHPILFSRYSATENVRQP